MTVTTIASIAAAISRASGNQTTRTAALFSDLFSATPKSGSANGVDTANFSAAINLQNQVAQFRVASQNVAQSTSLLAAAEAGAGSILRDLNRLKDIATRASSANVSDDVRTALASEVDVIRARIDRTAKSTKFNNEGLLDGSSPQLRIAKQKASVKDLSIGSLTDDALFKGAAINLATPAGAKALEAAVVQAQAYANRQLENIHALQAGLDLASSTLQAAIQNHDASRASLNDSDFTPHLFEGSLPLQGYVAGSLAAQTKRLPPSLLQLLN